MPVIIDVALPGDSFALSGLLAEHPDIHIEIERLVPLGDQVLPFFWVSDGSDEHIEEALITQSIVESVTRLTEVDDRHLYQVTWNSNVNGLVDALMDTGGVILEGQGQSGRWELRLRFPDHERLRRFSEICTDEEISTEVKGVYNPHVPSPEERLTPVQWETLTAAHRLGYFEVPRRVTLTDLAERFDVSEQAVSQRLRRAMNALVGGLTFERPT
ncbi:bacterio-opsin activator domain-containing protein [Halobium salinum]|uniref:Bacterio-opsin activator domain-containing protein n=1 Tax=Halobium salinum TaxID=1364940 RepID=A0ABD5P9A5_9EURY|nr:helix-turn-helix domain-containing protein [Halobium salinum]